MQFRSVLIIDRLLIYKLCFLDIEWIRDDGKRKNSKKGPPIALDRFLAGREDNQAHRVLMQLFMPHVVGRKQFREGVVSNASTSQLCTVSDEALVHLILDNCWGNWEDLFQKMDGRFGPQSRIKADRIVAEVPFKYTEHKDRNSDKIRYVWKADGIERYNELYHHIKADRVHHPDADRQWYARTIEGTTRRNRGSLYQQLKRTSISDFKI